MPCLSPISVSKKGYVDLRVTVACGQCIGCRVDRTEDWATRIVHEASLHDLSQFVTLTYSDKHLPSGNTLVKKDFQDFMKRLRKHHGKDTGGKLRYFAVGEYGDTSERAHYHAVIFGIDFSDKRPHSKNEHGDQLFTSDLLDSIWGKGHAFFGKVTVQSARYVAKYCIKKVNGSMAVSHYGHRQPEFAIMSLKPGIGSGWFQKYQSDVYPSDFLVLQGKKRPPPRFYDELYQRIDEQGLQDIKSVRLSKAMKHRADQAPERLKSRLACLEARVNLRKGKI
jgi:hypothetical protein